jgi:hypothetical protein
MNTSFFTSRCGVMLAAAGLAIAPLGMAALTATAALSLTSLPDSQARQAGIEPSSSIEPTNQLAQSQSVEDTVESLPNAIAEAVLKDVQERTGMQVADLKIVKVERQTWSDGCLGLGGVCTQALVPGWQVLVASEKQLWVYRTNESGSLVKLDEALSQTLTSRVTSEITRRQQVTTRTTQTVTGTSSGQSRATQTTQAATGTSQQLSTTTSSGTQVRQTIQTSFTDVSANYWAKDFITELTRRGILTGFPDGKFHPNEPVTRAQFAALVASVFKKTKVRNAINFKDVSTSHWAYNGIREAYEMGFLGGTSGNQFNPNQSLSRLQVLVALTRGLNYSASNSTASVLNFYSDATTIPADVRSLIAAATERGIVVNYPNVRAFSPNVVATRAEVAAFLYQAMVSSGDAVAISSPYVVGTEAGARPAEVRPAEVRPAEVPPAEVRPAREAGEADDRKPRRQNCNQGIGNGAEGCDPGNSRPHGGSNDEGGRTPGNRPK